MQVSYANDVRDNSSVATYGKFEQKESSRGKGDLFSSILQGMNASAMAFNDKTSSFVGNISSNSINALKQSVSKSQMLKDRPVNRGNDFTKVDRSDGKVQATDKDNNKVSDLDKTQESSQNREDMSDTAIALATLTAGALGQLKDNVAAEQQNAQNGSCVFTKETQATAGAAVLNTDGTEQGEMVADKTVNAFAEIPSDDSETAEIDADLIDRLVKTKDTAKTDSSFVKSETVKAIDEMAKTANVSKISLEDIKGASAHIKASDTAFSDDLTLIEKSMAQTLGLDKMYSKSFQENAMKDRIHTTLGSVASNNPTSQSVIISQALNTLKMSVLKSQSTLSERFSNVSLESANTLVTSALKTSAFNMQNGSANSQSGEGSSFFNSFAQSGLVKNGIESNQLQKGKETFSSMHLGDNAKANAEEIASKVMAMAARNMKQMVIDLNPQNLGKMQIRIALNESQEAGMVSMSATSAQTRELLEGSIGRLRDILMQSGIATDTSVHELADNAGSSSDGAFAQDQGSGQQRDQGFDFIFGNAEEENAETESEQVAMSNALNDGRLHLFA